MYRILVGEDNTCNYYTYERALVASQRAEIISYFETPVCISIYNINNITYNIYFL